MVNTDKVKAARAGGGLKYAQNLHGIHVAGRVAHNNEQRLQGVHHQLRQFEDAGRGVATGKQYEHEEHMREQKLKREAKAAKSQAFRRSLEDLVNEDYGGASELAPCRFVMDARVLCRVGLQWAAGRVTALQYHKDDWPAGQVCCSGDSTLGGLHAPPRRT
jgi:hypothetical protein